MCFCFRVTHGRRAVGRNKQRQTAELEAALARRPKIDDDEKTKSIYGRIAIKQLHTLTLGKVYPRKPNYCSCLHHERLEISCETRLIIK